MSEGPESITGRTLRQDDAAAWPTVYLPASRARGLRGGVLCGAPAVLLCGAAFIVLRDVELSGSAVTGRLVSLSYLATGLPFAGLALFLAFQAMRWAMFAVWPRKLGILACPGSLELRVGPFGRWSYDAVRMEVRYPFELTDEEGEDRGFEAYLPENEQIARFLPRIRHSASRLPLDEQILRFASGSEQEIVQALLPVIAVWRQARPRPPQAAS